MFGTLEHSMNNNLLSQNLPAISGQAGLTIPFAAGVPLTVARILPYVTYIAVFLLLIYLLTGGLQLMFSRGDPKVIAMAQAKITNAIIGFIIVLFAYFITSIIGSMLGVPGFGGTIL